MEIELYDIIRQGISQMHLNGFLLTSADGPAATA